jgi:hypothetical protein
LQRRNFYAPSAVSTLLEILVERADEVREVIKEVSFNPS